MIPLTKVYIENFPFVENESFKESMHRIRDCPSIPKSAT